MRHGYAGGVARLWVEFEDFPAPGEQRGQAVDPPTVVLNIYGADGTLLVDGATPQRNPAVGRYEHDYTLPDGQVGVEYEWVGTIGGRDEVRRGYINIKRR